MFETLVVPSFGGGLDFRTHPGSIRDDQWSWSSGYLAKDGVAEVAPGYTLLATIGAAGEEITGIFQNPFTLNGAVVVTVDASNVVKLYTVSGTGGIVNPGIVGSGSLRGFRNVAATAGLLNGFLVITVGSTNTNFRSVVKFDGTTATAVTAPVVLLTGNAMVSFGGHLVIAGGAFGTAAGVITCSSERTVAWSASYNPVSTPSPEDIWDPGIGNDADNIILDDADSGVFGLAVVADDRCIVLTRHALHTLTPTGGLPSFTRRTFFRGLGIFGLRQSSGAYTGPESFYGETPLGCVFAAGDDFYTTMGGAPHPIGGQVFRYWKANLEPAASIASTGMFARPIIWHERLGMVIVPRPEEDGTLAEGLYYDPKGEAWSRVPWPQGSSTQMMRHAFIEGFNATGSSEYRHWYSTRFDRKIYKEDPTTTYPASFVETKDFAFSEPTADDYVDRIKVDWESTVGTDVLQVDVASRPDLNLSQVGPYGLNISNPTFVSLGALTAGQSELPVRVRGKYVRFRFSNTTGAPRIRGFSIRRERGGDRKT